MKIAVTSRTGGVGKTTTAVYLAVALARSGHEVVLADADPQGSSLRWVDDAGGLGIASVGASTTEALRGLAKLARDADILIDTPPGDGRLVRAALGVADVALVPVRPSLLDLDRLEATMADVRDSGTPAAVLLTQARAGTRSLSAAREVLDGLGLPLLATVIPAREAVVASFGTGPDLRTLAFYQAALAELMAAAPAWSGASTTALAVAR